MAQSAHRAVSGSDDSVIQCVPDEFSPAVEVELLLTYGGKYGAWISLLTGS
jgi:hypothetical protein